MLLVFQAGTTPLHLAITGNHRIIVELLITKYNASPTESTTVCKLHVVCLSYKALNSPHRGYAG